MFSFSSLSNMRRWLSATMRLPIRDHDDLLSVGRDALQCEQPECGEPNQHQRMEILVDIGLVDEIAEQIGGERRAKRRNAHQPNAAM